MVCGRDPPRNTPPPPHPLPTGLSSLWAGTAQKRASETQHPEDGEKQGGGETSWMVWEWVEDLKKSIKVVPSYICLFLRPYKT